MRPPGSAQQQGLLKMIQFLFGQGVRSVLEVGSYRGESTVMFAQSFPTVYAVDPFLPDYDPEDEAGDPTYIDTVKNEFLLRQSLYPNITLIQQTSEAAAAEVADGSFDFIYIDADHRYEPVKRDIELWLPKVKKGMWIGGHDFEGRFPGVVQAVNERFRRPFRIFEDNSWIVKP
jgi:predicted O-methyltransferase YrrM